MFSFFSLYKIVNIHDHVALSARISLTLSLSPPLPNVHCLREVFKATSHIELVVLPLLGHVTGPQEYITYELVPTSPAMPCMSASSNSNGFVMGVRWP